MRSNSMQVDVRRNLLTSLLIYVTEHAPEHVFFMISIFLFFHFHKTIISQRLQRHVQKTTTKETTKGERKQKQYKQ